VTNILVHEADRVYKQGVIFFPCRSARPTGRIKTRPPKPGTVVNVQLVLSSGKRIPWTPASQIGW